MDKQYKNFMKQQNISAQSNRKFYEKLENAGSRKRSIRWKGLVAAVCIALMIPITVFAAEYIFGTPKVKLGKLDWYDGPNGYSITFDQVDSFPMDAFPKELQTLSEHKRIPYDSWEAAEEALGIDLLNNTFLSNAEQITMRYEDTKYAHSTILYSQHKGQLYYVSTMASYQYDQLQLDLKAKLTVAHPEMDEETKQALLGLEGAVIKPNDVEISYEEYATKAGIPVVILRKNLDRVIQYTAVFAVNDIAYELTAWVSPERQAQEKQILLDALDGFLLK